MFYVIARQKYILYLFSKPFLIHMYKNNPQLIWLISIYSIYIVYLKIWRMVYYNNNITIYYI